MNPRRVVILGVPYRIAYKKKASDVDLSGRESYWGQIDYWTRTIRIYDNDSSQGDILVRLLHECLEGIVSQLSIKSLQGNRGHNDLDRVATALSDMLMRNKWLNPSVFG